MTEIIIDEKSYHRGGLHAMLESGGTIKFQNFPFGIHIHSTGNGPMVWIKLFVVPSGDQDIRQVARTAFVKKKKSDVETEEQATIEM